jgi:hypothetical protein
MSSIWWSQQRIFPLLREGKTYLGENVRESESNVVHDIALGKKETFWKLHDCHDPMIVIDRNVNIQAIPLRLWRLWRNVMYHLPSLETSHIETS